LAKVARDAERELFLFVLAFLAAAKVITPGELWLGKIRKPNPNRAAIASRHTTDIYRLTGVRRASLNNKGGELCYATGNSGEM
jgi:hypothetical protein